MQGAVETVDVIQRVLDWGATGVLAMGIYGFMKGWIISSKNFDKALDAQKESAKQEAEIIATRICKEIEAAVASGTEKGIVRGYLKLNGGK